MGSSEGEDEVAPSSSEKGSSNALSTAHNGVVPVYARSKHSFEGRNNDELSFRKGEVIVVTQQLEGGWWEGTLNSSTGWFPSDYVTVISEAERFLRARGRGGPSASNGYSASAIPQEISSITGDSSRQTYRQQIMKGLLDSELSYVNGIANFYNDVLMKIKIEKKVSDVEWGVLAGNLQLLIAHQRDTFDAVKEAIGKDSHNAKVGGILLRAAPTLRQLLRFYCENHPRAIDLILKNKEEYEKIATEAGCELKEFISNLSRPFRHLETYPSVLNELERSMSESHPDRGDTQRAASVFRDIASYCALVRKQKEMQLELMCSGLVEGLTKEEMEQVGDIIYMGTVSVIDDDAVLEEQLSADRCIVLFPATLIVLEITPNMNAYVLNRRIPTCGIVLKKVEGKNAVTLCKEDGNVELTMSVSSGEELQRWIECFALCPKLVIDESCCSALTPIPPQRIEMGSLRSVTELSPLRKAEVSQLPTALKAANAKKISLSTGLRFDHDVEMILPETGDEEQQTNQTSRPSKMYAGYCLRPYPAVRGNYAVDYSKKANVKLRKGASQIEQEDAFLLRIIEGYCGSNRENKSVTPHGKQVGPYGYPPQLIVAEDEKIFVEEIVGDEVVVHEKSLVDTVYALKDQISVLQKEVRQLSATVDREQKARRRMEDLMRRYSQQYSSSSTPKPATDFE